MIKDILDLIAGHLEFLRYSLIKRDFEYFYVDD